MKSVPKLRLSLKASRIERLSVSLLHIAVVPMIAIAALPIEAKLPLVLGVLLSGGWWYRYGQKALPVSLRLLSDGHWMLGYAEEEHEADLQAGAYRTPWLVVLPLKLSSGKTVRLCLWPDSADTGELRQLRAWLRWGADAGESGDT